MSQAAQGTNRAWPSAPAQWLIVVTLSMLVGALVAQLLLSAPAAEAQTGSAGRSGTFAIAGQLTANTYGLYLVDTGNGTICLYEYVPAERRFWLRAARTFVQDLQLDAYNTKPPPKEIMEMVNQARRLKVLYYCQLNPIPSVRMKQSCGTILKHS